MKSEGFNLRERLNIHGRIALGALVHAAVIRYAIGVHPETILGEALDWGVSALVSFPFTVFPICSIGGGYAAGYIEARRLQNRRFNDDRSDNA